MRVLPSHRELKETNLPAQETDFDVLLSPLGLHKVSLIPRDHRPVLRGVCGLNLSQRHSSGRAEPKCQQVVLDKALQSSRKKHTESWRNAGKHRFPWVRSRGRRAQNRARVQRRTDTERRTFASGSAETKISLFEVTEHEEGPEKSNAHGEKDLRRTR